RDGMRPSGGSPQLGDNGVEQALLDLGVADLLDDLGEEAEHDETTCLILGDAARLQVEELLVVEAPGGARVACPENVTGLDLEVRDRVGAGSLGENEVAVLLVAVGSCRVTADEYVTDPDGARALALQRALVVHAATGVRGLVVKVDPLL